MTYIVILGLFVLLMIRAKKSQIPKMPENGKKVSFAEQCFEKVAVLLYSLFPVCGKTDAAITGSLVQLNPEENAGYVKWKYGVRKIKVSIIILFAGDVIALLLWVGDGKDNNLVDGRYIFRKEKGEGSKEVHLIVQREDGEEAEASLIVEEQRYQKEELDAMCDEVLELIAGEALGKNDSWDNVTKDLNLMDKVKGYPFSLSWESGSLQVAGDGKINYGGKEEESVTLVPIKLKIEYHDFLKEHTFYAKICPPEKENSFSDVVTDVLKNMEEVSYANDKVSLPQIIDEENVTWTERKEDKSIKVFMLGLVAAIVAYVLSDREVQKRVRVKSKQMEEEYPAIISKLTLYLGAGMNTKGAWEKIAKEGNKLNQTGKEINPVYREMLLTCREMDSGIAEADAYERFGKRIRRQKFIRLTTLLVQNLKKGNAALLQQLRQESIVALEEHAAEKKKEGEEMETKLLFPMMLIMGMVMVLIMVPAFLSI